MRSNPVVVGLGDMVRKTGYVERQLRRWHAQVHATGAPELALLDEVHDLLARRIPAQSGGIVHGDYRAESGLRAGRCRPGGLRLGARDHR